MKTNQAKILLVIGILFISTSQIVALYFKLSDFILGFTNGIGLGLLILSLIKTKKTLSA